MDLASSWKWSIDCKLNNLKIYIGLGFKDNVDNFVAKLIL